MLPKPLAKIAPNTLEFEVLPLVKPTGFREYDARWWFNGIGHEKAPELNFTGVQALGLGMGTLFHELGVEPKVVTGHDFRSISQPIKNALILGMVQGGCEVLDIGLALSLTNDGVTINHVLCFLPSQFADAVRFLIRLRKNFLALPFNTLGSFNRLRDRYSHLINDVGDAVLIHQQACGKRQTTTFVQNVLEAVN